MIYKLNTVPRLESATVVVHANQGEYGGVWTFQIIDGDREFTSNDFVYDPTVTLNIYKADKTLYSGDVEGGIESGFVNVVIDEQMTAAAGRAIAELVIASGDIRKMTANFIIDVERSPVDMGGVESETMINYIDANRRMAEEATQAAIAATSAANIASAAATQAAQDAIEAVSHIEAMPDELAELATMLAFPDSSAKWLGFTSEQGVSAFDNDYVIPQMFGAAGNGTSNDTDAFRDAIASGKRVVIPAGTYKLTSPIWSDDSVVISDKGTYNNKPLIISKNLREDAPIERFINQFNATDANLLDYRLQGGCYDSANDRIILAYCNNYTDVTDDTDLVLTAYRMSNGTDLLPLSGQSFKITGGGHGNGLCYNPDNQKIYSVTGNGSLSHQIAVIDASSPSTLTFEGWVNPITDGSRPWQMGYDQKNKVFYIESNPGSGARFKAYDTSFNEIADAPVIPFAVDDIKGIVGFDYLTDKVNSNSTIVIDGQIVQIHRSSRQGQTKYAQNGIYLTQYNYATEEPKKIYRLTSLYPTSEEVQCLVNMNGKIFLFSDIGVDGVHDVSIVQLVFDERVSGESESPYSDARVLATTGWHPDLNDLIGVGLYYLGSGSSEIGHCPTTSAFNLYVIPLFSKNCRAQIILTSAGDVYIRTYMGGTKVWQAWKKVTLTVQS